MYYKFTAQTKFKVQDQLHDSAYRNDIKLLIISCTLRYKLYMKTIIQHYENIAELNKNCNYERFYTTRLDGKVSKIDVAPIFYSGICTLA